MTSNPVSVHANVFLVGMSVGGLIGIQSPTLTLTSADGKVKLELPVEVAGVPTAPGENLLVSITLTRVAANIPVDAQPEAPGLILKKDFN